MTNHEVDTLASPKSSFRGGGVIGQHGLIRQEVSEPTETMNSNPASQRATFRGGNDIVRQDFNDQLNTEEMHK